MSFKVSELGVTIRVLTSFGDFRLGLQRVAELMQQAQHRPRRHVIPAGDRFLGELGRRLRCSPQQRHRTTARLRMDQLIERREQTGLLVDHWPVAATHRTQAIRRHDPDPGSDFGLGFDGASDLTVG